MVACWLRRVDRENGRNDDDDGASEPSKGSRQADRIDVRNSTPRRPKSSRRSWQQKA
jgi:hypothetical protein